LLVFEGDGTGEGVQWRQTDQSFTKGSHRGSRASPGLPQSFP
jgi:hypothetical protein